MTVGLGTGSTAAYAVLALGERVRKEALNVRCIATSDSTARLAAEQGIELVGWDTITRFDITIDGADEVDPQFRMIKGGGGALLREKIVASLTDTEIIIVDARKDVAALGAFPLPLAVIPFGWQAVQRRIEDKYNRPAPARLNADGSIYLTDENFVILDVAFGAPLPDPDQLEPALKNIPGVAEVGLFLGLCSRLIIGHEDGRIEERVATANRLPSPL
jgi:ribose 5-phosphate isomerase A